MAQKLRKETKERWQLKEILDSNWHIELGGHSWDNWQNWDTNCILKCLFNVGCANIDTHMVGTYEYSCS